MCVKYYENEILIITTWLHLTLTLQDLFYSRKNYKRPELQQEPHRTFSAEAALLDAMFHGKCFFQLAISSVLVTSIFLVSK